jgi:hypothetical protein
MKGFRNFFNVNHLGGEKQVRFDHDEDGKTVFYK